MLRTWKVSYITERGRVDTTIRARFLWSAWLKARGNDPAPGHADIHVYNEGREVMHWRVRDRRLKRYHGPPTRLSRPWQVTYIIDGRATHGEIRAPFLWLAMRWARRFGPNPGRAEVVVHGAGRERHWRPRRKRST